MLAPSRGSSVHRLGPGLLLALGALLACGCGEGTIGGPGAPAADERDVTEDDDGPGNPGDPGDSGDTGGGAGTDDVGTSGVAGLGTTGSSGDPAAPDPSGGGGAPGTGAGGEDGTAGGWSTGGGDTTSGGEPSSGSGPSGPACGDGTCDAGETCESCASDCGACAECSGATDATTGLDAEELAFLDTLNAYRAENGRGPLTACTSLNRAAQGHSEWMRGGGDFGHTGVNGSDPWERACDACYEHGCGPATAMAENVAAGNPDAAGTFSQWRNSSGHNANMLGASFTQIGIGRATGGGTYGAYWTTVFGGADEPSCN